MSDLGKPSVLYDLISQHAHHYQHRSDLPWSRPPHSPDSALSMGTASPANSIPIAPITDHPAAVPLPYILNGHSRPSTIATTIPAHHRPSTLQGLPFKKRRTRDLDALKRHQEKEANRREHLRQSFNSLRDCLPETCAAKADASLVNCHTAVLEDAVRLVQSLHEERDRLKREWEDLIMGPMRVKGRSKAINTS